ncbi:DNA polymerase beta-like protein [Endogone sp. FLAS-F59071]|nr:DNA polymerase beta-like protein [Endogone sp. FLAS-F59071]|eukprot:RUS17040.1 DNA polymerase beta-like protein [Endogone sp. FLAS-F59071]
MSTTHLLPAVLPSLKATFKRPLLLRSPFSNVLTKQTRFNFQPTRSATGGAQKIVKKSSKLPQEKTQTQSVNKSPSVQIKESPNRDICEVLERLAIQERNNGQPFKERAYQKAMRSIVAYPTRLNSGKEAQTLPGVGDKIAKKIDQFLETGSVEQLLLSKSNQEEADLINLFQRISGIGPVKAKSFVDKGYKSLEDLAKEPQLTHHQRIGLKYIKEFEEKIPRDELERLLDIVKKATHEIDPRYIVEACGSFRRGANVSNDLDIILTHPDFTEVMESATDRKKVKTSLLMQVVQALENCGFLTDSISKGSVKYMGVCQLPKNKTDGLCTHHRIDLRLIPHQNYYAGLLAWTGDDEHNRIMRLRAKARGYTLSEYGLVRKIKAEIGEDTYDEKIHIQSEEDVFKVLDMPYKKPHERNMRGVVKKKYLMHEE